MKGNALLEKYWSRYADPLAREALSQDFGEFASALVIPAHNETPDFIEALLEAGGMNEEGLPRLAIVVVNETDSTSDEARRMNRTLLDYFFERANKNQTVREGLSTLHSFDSPASLRILSVNLCTDSHRLKTKEGVGRARKVGADIALEMYRRGRIRARYLGSSDCDVSLPPGYFEILERESEANTKASALLFPYEHVGGSSEHEKRMMSEVESTFRYYVLGLARAGSPYAYHSLGSSLSVSLSHYAQARGFPNRQAGEDFYLLAKLAKLAPLKRLRAPRIQIKTRVSDRVPFGTGLSLNRALNDSRQGEGVLSYHPDSFRALGRVLSRLEQAVLHMTPPSSFTSEGGGSQHENQVVHDTWASISAHLAHCPSSGHRLRRFHESFDALSTLRFIHAAHDEGRLTRLPIGECIAAFCGDDLQKNSHQALSCLRAREEELSALVGPSLAVPA